ncbi:MAG: nodulation protein NfeD [Elusimicrobia bacterium]|nr:nodulation protein NfeD [Elusimicrobiota bacterium]
MKKIILFALFLALPQTGVLAAKKAQAPKLAQPQSGKTYAVTKVLAAPYAGVITPAAAEFMDGAIDRANEEKYDLLVLELDTPGGLDTSMRDIIKKILASKVPVAVYVYPQGARAASAGVFIAMAAHLAVMSPGTNIGAAHPVMLGAMPSMGGEKEGNKKDPMEAKVLNDASAYINSITRQKNRNVEWAIKAVTKSDSIPAEEALKLGVADLIASDMNDLLLKINGREVESFGRLAVKDPKVDLMLQTRRQKFLAAVTDPNIAMILMSLGAAGLFIELYNPGLILPGVVGAMSLLLAFYSFQALSANFAGLALILLGFVFFIAEIKVVSYGLLTLGGAVSIILGALMLFNRPSLGGLSISMTILTSTLISLIAVVAALAWVVLRAQLRRVVTGIESLAGKKGLAKTALNPKGTVLVAGELWEAESVSGDVAEGAEITVTAVEGFKVRVKK